MPVSTRSNSQSLFGNTSNEENLSSNQFANQYFRKAENLLTGKVKMTDPVPELVVPGAAVGNTADVTINPEPVADLATGAGEADIAQPEGSKKKAEYGLSVITDILLTQNKRFDIMCADLHTLKTDFAKFKIETEDNLSNLSVMVQNVSDTDTARSDAYRTLVDSSCTKYNHLAAVLCGETEALHKLDKRGVTILNRLTTVEQKVDNQATDLAAKFANIEQSLLASQQMSHQLSVKVQQLHTIVENAMYTDSDQEQPQGFSQQEETCVKELYTPPPVFEKRFSMGPKLNEPQNEQVLLPPRSFAAPVNVGVVNPSPHEALLQQLASALHDSVRANSAQGTRDNTKPLSVSLKDLPTFDGTDSTKLPKFFEDFDRCQTLGRWQNEAALDWFKSSMRGYAKSVFEQEHKNRDFATVEDAKKFLREHFLGVTDQQSAMNHLMSIRQGNTQPISELHAQVLALGEVALVALPTDSRNMVLKGVFINALRSANVRDFVDRAKPSNLNEAMKIAIEETARASRRKEDDKVFKSDQNSIRENSAKDQKQYKNENAGSAGNATSASSAGVPSQVPAPVDSRGNGNNRRARGRFRGNFRGNQRFVQTRPPFFYGHANSQNVPPPTMPGVSGYPSYSQAVASAPPVQAGLNPQFGLQSQGQSNFQPLQGGTGLAPGGVETHMTQ